MAKKSNSDCGDVLNTLLGTALLEHEAEVLAKELVDMCRCPTWTICPYDDPEEKTVAGCIKCWRQAARQTPTKRRI